MQTSNKPKRRIAGVLLLLMCILFLDSTGFSILLVRITGGVMDWRSHYLAGLFSTNGGRVRVREDARKAAESALKSNSEVGHFVLCMTFKGLIQPLPAVSPENRMAHYWP